MTLIFSLVKNTSLFQVQFWLADIPWMIIYESVKKFEAANLLQVDLPFFGFVRQYFDYWSIAKHEIASLSES